MQEKVSFSMHAKNRIYQRTPFSLEEIANIVSDPRQRVPLGKEGDCTHLLAYSPETKEYFIILVSKASKTVITVKPAFMNNSVPTSERSMKMAKRLAHSTSDRKAIDGEVSVSCVAKHVVTRKRVRFDIGDFSGGWNNLDDLLQDRAVLQKIEAKLDELRSNKLTGNHEIVQLLFDTGDAILARRYPLNVNICI